MAQHPSWEIIRQYPPNDPRLVKYFDTLTLSMWLSVNRFAAFGPPLIEHLDATNLDRIKGVSQSEIQEFVDILKEEEPSIDLRSRTRFKRQFYELVTKYSLYIKNKQDQPPLILDPKVKAVYSKFLESQKSLSALCVTEDEVKTGGYDADGLMSPLKGLLNDAKYGEICDGLRDKHNKLLNEFNTLQTKCLGEWKLNVHNVQRLQEMQNKMSEFEHLQKFKSWYQAELGQLICIDFVSALQQKLDHILKQSQNITGKGGNKKKGPNRMFTF